MTTKLTKGKQEGKKNFIDDLKVRIKEGNKYLYNLYLSYHPETLSTHSMLLTTIITQSRRGSAGKRVLPMLMIRSVG